MWSKIGLDISEDGVLCHRIWSYRLLFHTLKKTLEAEVFLYPHMFTSSNVHDIEYAEKRHHMIRSNLVVGSFLRLKSYADVGKTIVCVGLIMKLRSLLNNASNNLT